MVIRQSARIFLFSLMGIGFLFSNTLAQNFDDPFNYANGNLNGQGLWTGANGTSVASASALTLAGYVAGLNMSDAAVLLPNGAFNGRVSANFATDISSGSAFLSCLFRVDTGFTTFNLTSVDLIPNSGFSASTRVGFGAINTASTGNNNSFVVFVGSNTSFSSAAFSVGTVYHVLLEYQFVAGANNDVVNLYVSPTTMDLGALPAPIITATATGGDPLTEAGAVSFANDNLGGDVIVDGIRVTDGSVPVPVSLYQFSIE